MRLHTSVRTLSLCLCPPTLKLEAHMRDHGARSFGCTAVLQCPHAGTSRLNLAYRTAIGAGTLSSNSCMTGHWKPYTSQYRHGYRPRGPLRSELLPPHVWLFIGSEVGRREGLLRREWNPQHQKPSMLNLGPSHSPCQSLWGL